MTEGDLLEIEARANKASTAPWMRNGKTAAGWRIDDCDENKVGMAFLLAPVGIVLTDDNAAFIANARQDVPDLIAEVRRLRVELIKACEPLDKSGEVH